MSGENRFFYKERPYAYILIGVLGIFLGKGNWLAIMSSVILLVIGVYVLYIRKDYQDKQSILNYQHRQLSKKIEESKNKNKI